MVLRIQCVHAVLVSTDECTCIHVMLTKVAIVRETIVEVDVVTVGTFRSRWVTQLSIGVGTCVLEVLDLLYISVVVVVCEGVIGTCLLRHKYIKGIKRDSQVRLQSRGDFAQVTCDIQS